MTCVCFKFIPSPSLSTFPDIAPFFESAMLKPHFLGFVGNFPWVTVDVTHRSLSILWLPLSTLGYSLRVFSCLLTQISSLEQEPQDKCEVVWVLSGTRWGKRYQQMPNLGHLINCSLPLSSQIVSSRFLFSLGKESYNYTIVETDDILTIWSKLKLARRSMGCLRNKAWRREHCHVSIPTRTQKSYL